MSRVQGQPQAWRNHVVVAGGDPERALLPVFDVATDPGNGPGLTYKVAAGDVMGTVVVEGANLAAIVVADLSRDVKVGGNSGPAPTVGLLVATPTTVTLTVNAGASSPDDYWGIILRDAAGNAYGAPSPLKIFNAP